MIVLRSLLDVMTLPPSSRALLFTFRVGCMHVNHNLSNASPSYPVVFVVPRQSECLAIKVRAFLHLSVCPSVRHTRVL